MIAGIQRKQFSIFNISRARWLLIVGGVWVLLAVTYGIIAAQTSSHRQELTHNGVSLVKTFVEQAGLPLLEQDTHTLRQMLTEIGQRPNVLYASVVDHKRKIIAYTDQGKFLPVVKETASVLDGVQAWQDKEIMFFTSPITFSATPIGEVYLAFSTEAIGQANSLFIIIIVMAASLLGLLAFVSNGHQLIQWTRQIVGSKRTNNLDDADAHMIICPLCGQQADHGAFLSHKVDTENDFIIRVPRNPIRQEGTAMTGLRLSQIGGHPQLVPLKNRMIRKCAEIIRKLAVDGKCME